MGPAGNRGIQTALGTTGRGTVTVGPTKTGRARLAPEQPPADPSSASTGPTAEPSADAGKHSWRRKAWQVRTKVRLRKPHRAPDLHPVSYPGRRGRTRSSSTADRRKPFPGSAAPQKWGLPKAASKTAWETLRQHKLCWTSYQRWKSQIGAQASTPSRVTSWWKSRGSGSELCESRSGSRVDTWLGLG